MSSKSEISKWSAAAWEDNESLKQRSSTSCVGGILINDVKPPAFSWVNFVSCRLHHRYEAIQAMLLTGTAQLRRI